jgi:hypothetical protein
VVVGEAHLEGVERHRNVGPVFVAARRDVPLNHADGVLRELAAVVADALPVAIGDLGDDLASLFDGFEHEANVELAADRALDADFHVVEVDENGNAGTTCVCGHEKCCVLVGVFEDQGVLRSLERALFSRPHNGGSRPRDYTGLYRSPDIPVGYLS